MNPGSMEGGRSRQGTKYLCDVLRSVRSAQCAVCTQYAARSTYAILLIRTNVTISFFTSSRRRHAPLIISRDAPGDDPHACARQYWPIIGISRHAGAVTNSTPTRLANMFTADGWS